MLVFIFDRQNFMTFLRVRALCSMYHFVFIFLFFYYISFLPSCAVTYTYILISSLHVSLSHFIYIQNFCRSDNSTDSSFVILFFLYILYYSNFKCTGCMPMYIYLSLLSKSSEDVTTLIIISFLFIYLSSSFGFTMI